MTMENENRIARRGTGNKPLTREQGAFLAGYKAISEVLAEDLTAQPALREELAALVHNPRLTYGVILRHFFYESGRDFRAVVESPFIRGVEATTLCDEDERALIARMRKIAMVPETPPEEDLAEFQEWVDSRIPFIARGLQYFVRHGGVIEPLTPEEVKNKNLLGASHWREANPIEAANHQWQMTEAAKESAHPTVYTDEVRSKMQEWFDKGYNYDLVAELLKGVGVNTTSAIIKSVVQRYQDLHYSPAEIEERQRKDFQKAARLIFEATRSTPKTMEVLETLGYKEGKIGWTFRKLGIRQRVDWAAGIEVEGQTRTMEDLVLDFTARSKYPTLKDEYNAFIQSLKEKGIDTTMTEDAYTNRRQQMLKSLNS